MPGGFGDSSSGGAAPPPPSEITKPLALSLEELYKGGTKRLKITRHLRNGSTEEKVLEVAYKPGWKKVSPAEPIRLSVLHSRTHRAPRSSSLELETKTSTGRHSESAFQSRPSLTNCSGPSLSLLRRRSILVSNALTMTSSSSSTSPCLRRCSAQKAVVPSQRRWSSSMVGGFRSPCRKE
jgi:hypothetical protein